MPCPGAQNEARNLIRRPELHSRLQTTRSHRIANPNRRSPRLLRIPPPSHAPTNQSPRPQPNTSQRSRVRRLRDQKETTTACGRSARLPIPAEKGQPEQQQSAESLSLARAPRIRSWLVAGALENEKRKGEWGRKRKAESEVQR